MNTPDKPDSTDNNTSDGLEQSFTAAIRAAKAAPESGEAWDHLEDLTESVQRPEEVAEAYREMLTPKLPPDIRESFGERAVNFHEEWFGDNPEEMGAVLSRILEIDPDASWAFERLTVVYTATERWDELLAAYDQLLASTTDEARTRQLLDDAAQVAKDFANDLGRAVDYLDRLLKLDPGNNQLASSTERLLERLERWEDLTEMWRGRLDAVSEKQARALRMQIVGCCLDNLADPAQALEELRALLDVSPGDPEGCQALERVLGFDDADVGVRLAALELLKTNYDAAKDPAAAVAAIETALGFARPEDRPSLFREAGMRLALEGKEAEAMGHWAKLLLEDPGAPDARKQLRLLAQKSDNGELHAAALEAAAESCPDPALKAALLVEAATIFWDVLRDTGKAIDLFTQVLATDDIDHATSLSVAHNLNELLASAGRNEERLAVLERLASLERATAVRRIVLGEAAGLAQELGDPDKAVAFWQARLETDEHDVDALNALVNLLEQHQRWDQLIDALHQRTAAPVLPEQVRTDLVRVAVIQAAEQEKVGEAIDTWLRVLSDFGPQPDLLLALDGLMALEGRWHELATLLEGAAETEYDRAVALLTRLGEISRAELDRADKALQHYSHALIMDPSHEGARAGLKVLSEGDDAPPAALDALHKAYTATDDWQAVLEICEPRLAQTADPKLKAAILIEAASIMENQGGDPPAAFASYARAFPLAPFDGLLENNVMRLAEETDRFAEAAGVLREAAGRAAEVPNRAAELHLREGEIQEKHLADYDQALGAYSAVLEYDAGSAEAIHAAVRVAALAGQWTVAAERAIDSAISRDRLEPEVVNLLEEVAGESQGWDALTNAFDGALSGRQIPGVALARELEMKLVEWHRDRRNDLDAAQSAAKRAAERDPGDADSLSLLSRLQRREPGPALIETLIAIDAISDNDLDALAEAAELTLELEDNYDASRVVLGKLYDKAARLWERAEPTSGRMTPQDAAAWSVDELVRLDLEADREGRAARMLLAATDLPFDAERRRTMRGKAAHLLMEQGQRARAIDLMSRIVEESPEDLETIRTLARLLEQASRIPELVVLLRRELALVDDQARRIEIRLEISRLVGLVEGRDERVESLKANLEEEPGHPASVEALYDILLEKARHAALAEALTEQSKKLEELEDKTRAANLWGLVADLSEKQLVDTERAIFAHTRVVELDCQNESLDALARLCLTRGAAAEAATWLRRRLLDTEDPLERVAVMLRLARAQIQASQLDRAVTTLETAFAEAPRNAEVRKLLANQYRAQESWEPLARVLATSTEHLSDEATILTYAREAAEIYNQRLGTPERAVPVLERALPLADGDRTLRAMLAEGLLVDGRLDEARELVSGLLEDFGRRRSAERAAAHLLFARIAHAQGDTDAALEQLELASKMDSQNVAIWQTLAETAREAGQLDKAERAYRTLLLIVRRGQQDEEAGAEVGASEVLIQLSRIATDQGQEDKASELCESALEALSKNDAEASRLTEKLLGWGNLPLLVRVFETRLNNLEKPRVLARVQSEYADLLADQLEQPEKAFETRLKALENDPGSPPLHDAAIESAAAVDRLPDYIAKLEALFEGARRDTDAHVRCEILLRLSGVMEKDLEDLDKAWDYFTQAEQTGVREIDVWRVGARLAGTRGDKDEQMRLLTDLSSMGEEEVETETRADVFYRLAEIQLAVDETREEGLTSLRRALGENQRNARAGRILKRSCEACEPDEETLALYEQVARDAEDDEMLLDYLERRADHAEATPEQIREGAELAERLEYPDRAESLLNRAVEIGAELLDGAQRIGWAMLGLARKRHEAGDLAAAIKWLTDASETADADEVFALAGQLAEAAAGPEGDPSLAVKLYEQLLERDPTARSAWEPLAELYITLGDADQLERLVDEVLGSLTEPADRNALRIKYAKLLLASAERQEEAVELLKDVLLENPAHDEAVTLLVDHFNATENTADLIDLLRQQFAAAQDKAEAAGVRSAALHLGAHLEKDDPEEAVEVYTQALELATDDREILERLLALNSPEGDPEERARLLERLAAGSEGDEAAAFALDAAEVYTQLEDAGAALRALEVGYRQAPSHEELRTRLKQLYQERGDNSGLIRMLVEAAAEQADPSARAAMLGEAALVHRDSLEDFQAAAELQREIIDIEPEVIAHRVALADTLALSGDNAAAAAEISALLEQELDSGVLVELLVKRAAARARTGDGDGALADLESAFAEDPSSVSEALETLLEERRQEASGGGDRTGERAATIRLAEVLLYQEKTEPAVGLLGSWIDKEPEDRDVLRLLVDLHRKTEEWDAQARVSASLVELTDGQEQVDAVKQLSEAYQLAGNPDAARPQLEIVLSNQPDNREIRDELCRIYETTGAHSELAALLMQQVEAAEDPSERAELLRRVGTLYLEDGDIEQAGPVLEAALSLNPQDLKTAVALIDIHLSSGNLEEASALIETAISASKNQRSPELALLQQRKSRVARSRGDGEEEMKLLKQAVLCDRTNGAIAVDLADRAEEIEEWDMAVWALKTIALMKTGAPISRAEVFLRQGKISLKRGDERRAMLFARQAQQEDPDFEPAKAFLAELGGD